MLPVSPLQAGLVGPETLPLLLIVAGLVLSIAEAMAPGAHFIVVGIALLGAGLVGLVLGPLASPFVLGVLVLLFGALAFYGYHELSLDTGDSDTPISSDSLRGQLGIVTEQVTGSDGQVRLERGGFNPYYAARALEEDIPEGEEVIVVDPGGGNVVTVASLNDDVDEIDRELARGREQIDPERLDQQRRSGGESATTGEDTASGSGERDRELNRDPESA